MSGLKEILQTLVVANLERHHPVHGSTETALQDILDWIDKEIIGKGKGVECSRVVKLRAGMRKKLLG